MNNTNKIIPIIFASKAFGNPLKEICSKNCMKAKTWKPVVRKPINNTI